MKSDKELSEEIAKIASQAGSLEKAIENIIEVYPEIDAEELRKQFVIASKEAEDRFYEKRDSEVAEELSDSQLESVAGGSFGSWMKKNWPYVLGAAVIVTAGSYLICHYGLPSKAARQKRFDKGVEQGFAQGESIGDTLGTRAGNMVERDKPATFGYAEQILDGHNPLS